MFGYPFGDGIIISFAHKSFELWKCPVQLIPIPIITKRAIKGILLSLYFNISIRNIEPIVSARVRTLKSWNKILIVFKGLVKGLAVALI